MRRCACLVWVVLLAGCHRPSPPPDDEPDREIPEEYDEPPAPCPAELADAPIVALRWRRAMQTFLEPGPLPERLALDYEVWPLAHVDRVLVHFDFDATITAEPVTREETCPLTLPMTSLMASTLEDQIVRAVVQAGDDEQVRRGELYFATGQRHVEVQLPEGMQGDGWHLLFEPASGRPRVIVKGITTRAGTVMLDHLPSGSGVIALVQAPSALRDENARVVYLPQGFAQDWPTFVTGWYAALVSDETTAPVTLTPAVSPDVEATIDLLRHPTELDEEDGLLVLGPDAPLVLQASDDGGERIEGLSEELGPVPEGSRGSVRIPCGTHVRAFLTSFARAELRWEGEHLALEPGEAKTFPVTCGDSSTSTLLGIRTRSLNGQDARLVLRLVTDEATDDVANEGEGSR